MTHARFELAGVKYRLQAYTQANVKLTDVLRLVPEPQNPHDPSAIAVYKGDIHIGYVPHREIKGIHPYATAGTAACEVEAATPLSCWVRVDLP